MRWMNAIATFRVGIAPTLLFGIAQGGDFCCIHLPF